MEFHGMRRKDLQTLCKKYGIPGNLKNIEMATRLASLSKKETVKETRIMPEDSVESDGIKDAVLVRKEAKRVRFSPEIEVFEFTRSVKNCQRKNVRMRSQGHAQDLQQGGIALRRSKRSVAKGITVAGSVKYEPNTRRGGFSDVTKALEVPRRSKRIGSSVCTQEDCKVAELMALEQFKSEDISEGLEKIERRSTRLKANLLESCVEGGTLKAKTLLPAKQSQQLVDTENKKDELVQNNVKDISMDLQDDPKVDKVPGRSNRFVNDIDVQTNTQTGRRSIRLKARAVNSSMGGEISDRRPLCSAKENKKDIKPKQSKGSTVVNSQEGELVKNKIKEPLIDCEVKTAENYRRRKVQDGSIVEKVPRRLKRLGNVINVLMDKRPVKAVKREKSISELLVDGQAQKGDKLSKRTFGGDREDKKLLQSSKLTAFDNMSDSPKSCSVIDCERDGASVANAKKSNVNDEAQVRVRFTRNSSRHGSFEAPIVVEGNLVEKKMDETLEKKRDRSAEPGMDIETTSTQSNLTPKILLDQYAQFDQEEAGGTNVESGGSSKKPKTMNQECFNDMPQGMIESSPSSSETKAAESVMVTENVLDSELKEGKCEEKLERDTVLMAAIEEDRDEVLSRSVLLIERLSPASVQLAVSNPEAELVVPTTHILVKDIASTAIICTPRSELKECSSVAKLAKVEAIMENSTECWKEIHQSKDDEKGSLVKEVQGANLHGNYFEYNSAEEEMEITKAGYVSVGHCVNITPEKLLDDSIQLESEETGANVEARGSSKKMKTVNQECVKDKPQGMAEEDSPSTYETKAHEPVMISENVLDSTLKSSDDISPRGNSQELDSELMEGECEEKHEQDTVLVAAIKEKEKASSLSLIERSELSNREVELFVETTPPPAPEQLEVSNHEVELGVPTAHIPVKDIASTVIANEDIKTKEKIKSVAKLAVAEAILENSAECWNEIHSSKDDEKGSLEKKIQAETLHGNFSEYNTENSKVGCITVGHSGNLESLDEVKDDSLDKTEQTISCESGSKFNELELRRWSSTDFTSLSPKEDNTVSKCFKEDEIKALSQPLPRNKDVTVFDESAIFTTPERNLMLMEHVSENVKTPAAESVTHHKDEAVESHVVVFTTPKQVLLLGDAGIDDAGKEEDDTTTERYSMSKGPMQTEARNEGEIKVIELHDESDIATRLVRKFSVGNFKGDRNGRNEENRTVELQRESGICTRPERHELFGSFGQDKARERERKKVLQFYEESGLSTGLHRDQPLAESELGEAGWQESNSADKSGLFTSLETQLLYGDSEQKKAVKTGEKVDAELCDASDIPNIPERHPFTEDTELDEAAKSEEDKAVELHVDCGIFTSAEKHLLLETDEEMKGDNMTTNSHVAPDVFIASESQSHMGGFEPDVDMNVDLLGESNTSTNLESHLLFGDSGLDKTKKMKDHTAATFKESFAFTSLEKEQILVNSEPHSDGKEERNEVEFKDESAFFSRLESDLVLGESEQDRLAIAKSYLSQHQNHHSSSPIFGLKDDSMVRESHVAALGFRDNIIADSSGSMASKVSYNHEFNVEKDTAGAELMIKGSQAVDVQSLDGTQGKSKKNSEHSLQVDSVNLFDFDIEEAETILEAERNVSWSSYVLAGTCSMVSEESGSSTDFQNQMHDAVVDLAIIDNNETKELTEAKVTKNTTKGYEGNLLLNSSGGTETEHLGFDAEVDFGNTCEKSGPKFLEDEAAASIATAFDEEMIRRETTPSPKETLNESSETKEYLNIDESGTSSEQQVKGEPIFVFRTQVKLKSHDMKENAPNSKIVDNLNVTAPRTSKRQPLQDLRKI